MNRIVVYSGGFDSLCLLHDLMFEPEKEDTTTLLFFNYNQKNVDKEREMYLKACSHFKIEGKEIHLPSFSWDTTSSLLNEEADIQNQYIPMRNLIFISYALSMAESLNAQEIYLGFINPEGEYYVDTSPEFVSWFNSFSVPKGISVVTPFIDYTKEELIDYIRDYNISKEDFFSCNVPDEKGEPCGKCSDCEVIDIMFEQSLFNAPLDILMENGFDYKSPIVKEQLYSLDMPIRTAKLFINNSCNAKCSHCYLEHLSHKATIDVKKSIDILAKEGITFIDFFGKEPLVDTKVFEYVEYLQENYPHIDYGMITNGLNLYKYKELIVKYFENISISLEDFNPISRPLPENLKEGIKYLVDNKVKVEISLDLLSSNQLGIYTTIKHLDKMGVSHIYIKPIFRIGETTDDSMFITASGLNTTIHKLVELNSKISSEITLELKQPHIDLVRENYPNVYEDIINSIYDTKEFIYQGINLDLEFYCGRYQGSVTVSPYGNILGCGFEMSLPFATQDKMGSINNFKDSVATGKKKHYYLKNNCSNTCYFVREGLSKN